MNDQEAQRREEFAERLHNHLATAGPEGQELAAKIAPLLETHDIFAVLVALNMLRCFMEDSTTMPRDQFAFSTGYIYQFIRSQLDDNTGTPQ